MAHRFLARAFHGRSYDVFDLINAVLDHIDKTTATIEQLTKITVVVHEIIPAKPPGGIDFTDHFKVQMFNALQEAIKK